MKKIITAFFVCISLNTLGQTYSTIISDSLILSFLEWEIENSGLSEVPEKRRLQKKIYHKVYHWSDSEFIQMDSLQQINQGIMGAFNDYLFDEPNMSFFSSIIDSSDIEYMVEQYNGIKENILWDFQDNTVKIRKNNFRLHKKVTYFYSIPIFNKDKDVVFIKRMVYCGKLCAEHAVYIYKKISHNNWELVHFTNYWIS